jgi:hypothetical protein
MIERDYIMRMVQMLAAALARILVHRDQHSQGEALREIFDAGERLIGIKWGLFRSLGEEEIRELLRYERNQDKMLAAAELLREESEILFEEGKGEEAVLEGTKALALYVELVLGERSFLTVMSVGKFDALLSRLKAYGMPPELVRKLFRYHELSGRFAAAEDMLYELTEEDPSFAGEAMAFYKRLLALPDEELSRGGLPRAEVAEGLARLESTAGI